MLETLWESTPPLAPPRGPGALTALPETPHRFLAHAIAPGVPPATAVRLRMHGEIRLGRWWPFTAEEVIHRDRGMIWRATVRMHGLPVRGSDRLLDGEG